MLERIWWRLLVFRSRVINSLRILFKAPFVYGNWPVFLISRFQTGQVTLELRSGLKVTVRTQSLDRATASEVFLLGAYTGLPGFALKPDDIVLDVGANIGCFTLKAAKACPQGRVVAVEPLRENYELLQHNLSQNQLSNVRTCCVALDASDGSRVLHHGGQCPSLHFSSEAAQGSEVQTRSLKSFLAEQGLARVDFLKMDCEGAEFDILLTAGPGELGCIRRIVMEYHNISAEKNHHVLAEHLQKNGFQVEVDEGGWNGELRAIRTD